MYQKQLNSVAGALVSDAVYKKLQCYIDLIGRWQKAINLVAPSTLPSLWERHILDSAQLLSHIPTDVKSIMDVGAGAGLPGVVLGLLNPNFEMTLVESDHRKAEFLKNVSRETFSSFKVICERMESLDNLEVDVIVSRACAPLVELLALVERQIKKDTLLLLLKGKHHDDEIKEAKKNWEFDLDVFASKIDQNGVVLKLQQVRKKRDGE